MAEQNPSRFHGVGPFDIETGKMHETKGPPTYTGVFGKTMIKLASKDHRIVAITAAMEYGTGLAEFARLFPDRFFDVGIAEQHGVIFAAGLALQGYRPVVAIYSTFMQRAYDHLIHDVCMQKLPVVFAMDRAGIVGEDGPTHHGVFDIAFTRNLPNLTVMAPSNEDQLADMLATAVSMDGPCAIRYPRSKGLGVSIKKEPETIQVGRAELVRQGRDLTIAAIGSMVGPSVEAAEIVEAQGFSVSVVDARFVKPLDEGLILSEIRKTGKLLTVEEGILNGGFGGAILELLTDRGVLDVTVSRLGIPDSFIDHGARSELLDDCGLTPRGIADRAISMLNQTQSSEPRPMPRVKGCP